MHSLLYSNCIKQEHRPFQKSERSMFKLYPYQFSAVYCLSDPTHSASSPASCFVRSARISPSIISSISPSINCHADSVIRNASLREVVGSDSFASVAGTDLAFARRCFFCRGFRAIHFIKAAFKHLHCLFFIAALAALILALNNKPRRKMRYSYRALRFVNVLPACVSGTR